MMLVMHILAFLAGLAVIVMTIASALRTFVLPRSATDPISKLVFASIRWVFNLVVRRANTYESIDRILALYAPIALIALLPVWYTQVTLGFTLTFWASGVDSWNQAFKLSGSSLLTLGFYKSDLPGHALLEFAAATIGLTLVALLIAYIPTMYGAFARREAEVNKLAVRAGSPPMAVEMLARFHRLNRYDKLPDFWERWENWFVDIEESHTSLAALVFFRSPVPDQSWVTASGAVMDAAAIYLSAVIPPGRGRQELTFRGQLVPHDTQAALCLRAGFLAMRRIADFFRVNYNDTPRHPQDPISISRSEFDEACRQLEEHGVTLVEDREQAWTDFAGWRVNYDSVLLALARLINAPYAPWSSDRSAIFGVRPPGAPRGPQLGAKS